MTRQPKSGPGARGGPKPLLCFRVADAERERWQRVAAGMGLGLSAWLRMVATVAARTPAGAKTCPSCAVGHHEEPTAGGCACPCHATDAAGRPPGEP